MNIIVFPETSRKRSILSVKLFYYPLKCILFRYYELLLEFVIKLFKIKKLSVLFRIVRAFLGFFFYDIIIPGVIIV